MRQDAGYSGSHEEVVPMRSFRFACLLAGFVLAAGASPMGRAADAFPTKPIRMVVTLAPGGQVSTVVHLSRSSQAVPSGSQ